MRPAGSRLLLCLALTLWLNPDALAMSGGALAQAARYDYAGYRLSEWKRDREAIVYYTAAIKANPADFVAYFNSADCYIREKEWSKALADCNAAARLKPPYADTYYLRASALYRLGRDAEARADLDRCERGKASPAAREEAAQLRVDLCQAAPKPPPDEVRASIQILDRSVASARTA